MKHLAALALMAGLGACTTYSGQPNDCQAHQGGVPTVITIRGCSVQLTPDWAVSAKHHPLRELLPNGVADDKLDLYFYKHQGPAPMWRDPVIGETVTAKGNPWTPLDLSGLTMGLPMRQDSPGKIKAVTTISPDIKD